MTNLFRIELSDNGNLHLSLAVADDPAITLVTDLSEVDIVGKAPDRVHLVTHERLVVLEDCATLLRGLLNGNVITRREVSAVLDRI